MVGSSAQGDYQNLLSGFRAGTASLPEAPEETETPAGNTVPATLHASLANTYALTFHVEGGSGCGSACSYVDEQAVEFLVHADGTLSVGGKTLSSPFAFKVNGNVVGAEISWRDGDLVYSLSNNSTGVARLRWSRGPNGGCPPAVSAGASRTSSRLSDGRRQAPRARCDSTGDRRSEARPVLTEKHAPWPAGQPIRQR